MGTYCCVDSEVRTALTTDFSHFPNKISPQCKLFYRFPVETIRFLLENLVIQLQLEIINILSISFLWFILVSGYLFSMLHDLGVSVPSNLQILRDLINCDADQFPKLCADRPPKIVNAVANFRGF